MSSQDYQVVEINGVKLEVDMRSARKIENYRIGDRVKVLIKDYSSYKPCPGVIVAFDLFEKMPTITVAYIDDKYGDTDIKFAYIHGGEKNQDDPEIAPYNDDITVSKSDVIERINRDINKKQSEIEDLERKKSYFLKNFEKYFSETE